MLGASGTKSELRADEALAWRRSAVRGRWGEDGEGEEGEASGEKCAAVWMELRFWRTRGRLV